MHISGFLFLAFCWYRKSSPCNNNNLLAVIAYACYAAICHPLGYKIIMNPCLCLLLVIFHCCLALLIPWSDVVSSVLLHRTTNPLHFLGTNTFTRLSCFYTLIDNILVCVLYNIFGAVPLSVIILSYIHIMSYVLRMSLSEGRYKAFPNHGFHISVVYLFYVSAFRVYMNSKFTDSSWKIAVA
jgi:olfactory receptor